MRIIVIFTGGTIASASDGEYISLSKSAKYKVLTAVSGAKFEISEPYTILSENLDALHLNMLIKSVYDAALNYDGVIVCHGTDTLQYAACACAYALGDKSVPVVFVSSNYTLDDRRANGYDNFKYAYKFITENEVNGTFISYRNRGECPKIHRASRAASYSQYSDCIDSIGGEYGIYKDGNFIKNPAYSELRDKTAPFGICDFTTAHIQKFSAYPDMVIADNGSAILLETYHSGTVPEKALKDVFSDVYITGVENRMQYESTKIYKRGNIHILRRAAAPAMYIKLWLCACTNRFEDMNKVIGSDFSE